MNDISPEKAFEIAARLDNSIGGEICAAIAMALDRCTADEVHDNESFVLTMKPKATPWNSRYATLRQLPDKKK